MEEPSANASASSSDSKHTDETASAKTAQCSVVSLYHSKIAGAYRSATVTWSKTLINHSFSLSVEKPGGGGENAFTCKVDLKPWPFWGKKGFKSFEIEGGRVDIFWDLRSAKFAAGPEPLSGYYVALVSGEEVVLLLGDCKKEAYKKTKSRPTLEDATLVSKRENVFGRKSFAARARFDEKKDHDIVVENSISGPKDPEMWISVDGVVLIHVNNLQWKFRGNETVLVERLPVQVFWDVHDWLFGAPGAGHALFIFKPGGAAPEHGAAPEEERSESSPAVHCTGNPDFCFYLYAWKME